MQSSTLAPGAARRLRAYPRLSVEWPTRTLGAPPYAAGMPEPLHIDRPVDGVVTLTLDVPDRRNAMTAELTDRWSVVVRELSTDSSLRCVIVTGAGPVFCAGGDLGWIAESPGLTVADVRDRMLPFYRTWLAVRDLPVPVIAAVNGPAVGAGLCLALACDLRYAAAGARFSAPFTALGMHPGMATTFLLRETIPLPVARELLYTGRVLSADEAAAVGLVNRVVPNENLMTEVLAVANQVAAQAPVATRLLKAALGAGGPDNFEQALQWEGLAQPVTLVSADLQEGLAAQRERRPPRFGGR